MIFTFDLHEKYLLIHYLIITMKRDVKGFLLLILSFAIFITEMKSQKDLTSLIVNPGFETGDYTGWSWSGRTDGWLDVNQDGDASKEGGFIGGYWSGTIADVECTQTIKGLENGYYLVTALATVSTGRLTNQRLFANNNSTLYGASTHKSYSQENLKILESLSEIIDYGNHEESSLENGPFRMSFCLFCRQFCIEGYECNSFLLPGLIIFWYAHTYNVSTTLKPFT